MKNVIARVRSKPQSPPAVEALDPRAAAVQRARRRAGRVSEHLENIGNPTRVPSWLISLALGGDSPLGLPLSESIEGTGLSVEQLSDPRTFVEWDSLVLLMQRLQERRVSAERVRRAFERGASNPLLVPMAKALKRIPEPAAAYELLVRASATLYFHALRHRREPDTAGYLNIHYEVVEGRRFHPLLWAAIEGWLHGIPALLDCAPVQVEAVCGEDRASFRIRLPERRSWYKRLQLVVLGWLDSQRILDRTALQQTLLSATFERLHAAHDTVERRAAALREEEARYRTIIENSADLILVLDARGRILMASPSARRVMELSPRAHRPVRALAFVHPDDRERVAAAIRAALAGESEEPLEFRILAPRDREVWVEASGRCVRSAAGQEHLTIVARDITARREAEHRSARAAQHLELEVRRRTQQLQRADHEIREIATRVVRAETIATMRELAGSVAHAINNPLAALSGNAELLREDQCEPDPSLDRVIGLAARIRSVVDRTLQLSRQLVLNLSLEDPTTLLREVHEELEPLAKSKGVQLMVHTGPELPTLFADRPLLRSALIAIGDNAIDASSSGQTVRMQARTMPGMRVVEFRFEDQGRGLSEEAERRMFEPFFSTKPGGTGLGLSVARGVIMGHEGRIYFEALESGGTAVTVEIPISVADRTAPEDTLSEVNGVDTPN